MVLDLKTLGSELDELERGGYSYNHLMISDKANVIMPYHIARDKRVNMSQEKGGIGSTGRGIGPCYADRTARFGVEVRDLFDLDVLREKIKQAAGFYPELNIKKKEIDDMTGRLMYHAQRIKPFVRDTVSEMHRFMRQGKKVLLEGGARLIVEP